MAPLQPASTPPRSLRRADRPASFHGKATAVGQSERQLRRPKTQPDLFTGTGVSRNKTYDASYMNNNNNSSSERIKLPAKILVNVTVQRSVGALQVMASTEWTVEQLLEAAVKQYVKEGRRPLLQSTNSKAFGLHYSQFSLECLDSKEKLIELGSRNFFMCPKSSEETASSSCSREAEKASKIGIPWLKFMDFLF